MKRPKIPKKDLEHTLRFFKKFMENPCGNGVHLPILGYFSTAMIRKILAENEGMKND